ncbi:MAG: nucleoside monophosphate kinase [Patescibacteria group bacterium]
MKLVFIGPPFAGKGTQAELLSKRLNIPVYSMGALIRDAYEKKDPRAIEGNENYSLKGRHVPTELKFPFLEEKLSKSTDGFILDNFPATAEDLEVFNKYSDEHNIKIDRVIYLWTSEEEMGKRRSARGRGDDAREIIKARREIQDKDRIPVIEYYKKKGILEEINGEEDINEIHKEILKRLEIKND